MLSFIVIPHSMDTFTVSSTTNDSTVDSSINDSMMFMAATTDMKMTNAPTTHKRSVEILHALQRTQTRRNLEALPSHQRTQTRSTTTTLHSTGYYSSNHVMVNRERVRRGVDPLQRCRHLDDLAAVHAQEMADRLDLFHSGTCADVQYRLKSRVVGENVQCGPDIRSMHKTCMRMHDHPNRINILSDELNQFGMGTSKGKDGYLYMVQLFRHVDEYRLL